MRLLLLVFLAGVTNDQAPLMLHDETDLTKIEDETEDTDKLLQDLEALQDLNQLEITDLLEKQKKVKKALTSTAMKDVPSSKLPASRETKNKIFEGSYQTLSPTDTCNFFTVNKRKSEAKRIDINTNCIYVVITQTSLEDQNYGNEFYKLLR